MSLSLEPAFVYFSESNVAISDNNVLILMFYSIFNPKIINIHYYTYIYIYECIANFFVQFVFVKRRSA